MQMVCIDGYDEYTFSTIQSLVDEFAPVRRVKVRRQPIADWMDRERHDRRRHLAYSRDATPNKKADKSCLGLSTIERDSRSIVSRKMNNGQCAYVNTPGSLVGFGV